MTNPWKPIETAPKDGTKILLRGQRGKIADGFWMRGGIWVWPYIFSEPLEWTEIPGEENAKSPG